MRLYSRSKLDGVSMRYSNFKIEDFLNDDLFVKWVLFNEQDAYWQQVMIDYPAKQLLIEQATQIVRQLCQAEGDRTSLVHEEQLWNRIRKNTIDANPLVEWPRKRNWRRALLICGIAVFIIGGGWAYWKQFNATTYQSLIAKASETSLFIEKVNRSEQTLKIVLEDGSTVLLGKNSRFSYPLHFGATSRETFLSGEAFFQIKANPQKPFYVYANELVTRVLGTSFTIKAFDDEQKMLVKVRTGRVSVYQQAPIRLISDESQHLILFPNQQVVFNRRTESLSKQLVDDPKPIQLLSDKQDRYYEDVPASTVFQALEKRYGIRIVYDEDRLSKCIITTTLGNQSLIAQLDVICQTIGATYKEIDAQLVIESGGCP